MKQRNGDKSFRDFLFNILLVFLVLLGLILQLPKKPMESEGKVEVKAEYLIKLEWPGESDVDMDLWVKGPKGNIVFFRDKSGPGMRLERDDLGQSTDIVNGEKIAINEEVITIRGTAEGDYVINAHVYSSNFSKVENLKAFVRVIKLNPYREVYSGEHTFNRVNEEHTFVKLTMNKDDWVIKKDYEHKESLIAGGLKQ